MRADVGALLARVSRAAPGGDSHIVVGKPALIVQAPGEAH
jgi:NADH-quinone oxidoreductase subunit M